MHPRERYGLSSRRLAIVAAACALVLWAGSTALGFALFVAQLDDVAVHATPSASVTGDVVYFRYRGCTRFVRVTVPVSELERARELDTDEVLRQHALLRGHYLRALVDSERRRPAVVSAIAELRKLRQRLRLDSDQYAELIARFVQAIPYGEVDGRVRPPAQVLVEGVAACDDRSVLLAALLVHEGYDTALFVFDHQAHAAVGIRSTGASFRRSGYAFIETNRPAFIGEIGGRYAGFALWRRSAQVVSMGGSRAYDAADESAYVASRLRDARSDMRNLERFVALAETGPESWRPFYRSVAERQRRAARITRIAAAQDFDRERIYDLLAERRLR